MKNYLRDLSALVAIPSVSADPKHAKDCASAARWVAHKLSDLGFSAQLVPTGGHPLVLATRKAAAAKPSERIPHIVIYGHYDVQPAEPLKLWHTPPFQLTVKGARAFGRGSTDNKGQALALLYGLAAALPKNPRVHLTCLIEGEEEIGSKNLPAALRRLKKQIGPVDAVVLSDTDSLSPRQLCITTGLRGVMAFDLTLRGLSRDLHSGNGGPIPNAARELGRVIGTLYDAQGFVTLPGFYKGIRPAAKVELASLRKTLNPAAYAKSIGAKGYYPMKGHPFYEINRFFPSLEINGLVSGYQGEGSKTIIPAAATAKMTCRVAAGQNPETLLRSIVDGLLSRVDKKLFDCEVVIHEAGAPAYAVPLPHLDKSAARRSNGAFAKAFAALHQTVRLETGHAPLYLAEGASIPILARIREILGADALMLGLGAEDAHIHSPDEHCDLKLAATGIRVWQRFFESFA